VIRNVAPTLLLIAALAVSSLGAQTASLVRDINTAPYVPVEASEGPQQFTPVAGGAVFFTLGGDTYPTAALWFTDGTAAGTRFVAAFCESSGCSHVPEVVATLPGLAFFLAESNGDLTPSPRLWRTDGTPAGTFPLTPQLHSFAYSNSFLAFGGRLLFSTCVYQGNACSLWRTDGTPAGTASFAPVSAANLVEAGGQVYFLGSGSAGRGLWRTDGTAAGTRIVRALPRDNYLWNLVAAGSRLFFQTGPDSGQVWTSDGTPAGTRLARSFAESGHEFLPLNTQILRSIGDGKVALVGIRDSSVPNLWVSDGTPTGTVRLTNAPTVEGRWVPRENQIEKLGKRLVFIAGSRLWSSGGSLATTRAVSRCPGGCPEVPADSPLVRAGNRVVFAGKDAAHGTELWVSDGTGPGTRLLADLCPGPCDSKPRAFTAAGGLVWFRANVSGSNGTVQLARTDGTAAGTVVLGRTVEEGVGLDLAVSGISGNGGKVFFTGFDRQYGAQPWVSDGTRGGTRRVTALPGHGGSSDPMDLTAFGDRLLFSATDGRETGLWVAGAAGASPIPGTAAPASTPAPMDVTVAGGLAFYVPGGMSELWRTDGTAAGTLGLASFPGQTLSDLHDLGGRLVFLVSSADGAAFSFWASDGTAAGTVKLFDLPAGTQRVSDVAVVGPELYFAAETSATKAQVFRSDGTAAGTRPILDLPCVNCTGPFYPLSYTRLGSLVYFTAWANGSNFSGPSLWRTDGTAAGTVRLVPDPASSGPLKMYFPESAFAFGGEIYFLAHDPTIDDGDHTVLFRGRDENAARLAPVGSPPFQPFAPDFTPVGSTLFFRAWDPEHGIELWKTDGTPQGTVLVRDLLPGPASSDPQDLTAAGGRLYFSARDAAHGRELWNTDGTAAGTVLVQDLAPGGLSSAPEQLTLVDGRLYFAADDGVVGREPWSVPIP
jgi:ELWxxDGT repeat protein